MSLVVCSVRRLTIFYIFLDEQKLICNTHVRLCAEYISKNRLYEKSRRWDGVCRTLYWHKFTSTCSLESSFGKPSWATELLLRLKLELAEHSRSPIYRQSLEDFKSSLSVITEEHGVRLREWFKCLVCSVSGTEYGGVISMARAGTTFLSSVMPASPVREFFKKENISEKNKYLQPNCCDYR